MFLTKPLCKSVALQNVGIQTYNSAMQIMKGIENSLRTGINETKAGTLLICEHPPVYTVGIRKKNYVDEKMIKNLKDSGADFCYSDRGGLITFHGPGQLVCYPVLNLKKFNPSIRCYINQLEQVVIDTCIALGIVAARTSDIGIWVANDTSNGIHSVEEMERVIAAMRRVVERLQTENDNFKKQTGKSKPHAELVKENRNLKQEIQRMKQLQTNENKRHNVPASTNKIMIQENEKLLKDLQKEREEVEKLRVNNQSLTAINNKLKENINEKDQALSEMEQKLGNITDGVKSPGGIITNKLYDGKIKALENKITKKNSILIDMKSHMRKSAEREAELLRKIEELEEKILLLQDAPVGEGDDSKQQLQQSRLVIDRLEKENKQLRFELERLRKLTNSGQNYIDVTQDEVLAKLERYDRMIAIEVELRTKLKSVEVEKEKYKNESIKLKKELSAFDPAFFEELEDLKYNYKQALEQNILYEQQLRELTNDFSAHVRH